MKRQDVGKSGSDRVQVINEIVKFIEIEEATAEEPGKLVFDAKVIEEHLQK